MGRSKPKGPVIAGLEQAAAALEELCRITRDISAREDEMNAAIDQAKARAAASAEPLMARRKELEAALHAFGQINKAGLFTKKKSCDTPFGTFGFRLSTRLATRPKVRLTDVLAKLKQFSFTEAIKTRESVDKEAMRDWPDERLELVGLERRKDDEFFIELKAEALGEKG